MMGDDRGCKIYGGDEVKGCRCHLSVCHNSCRVGILTLLSPHRYYNYISKMGDAQSRYFYVSWVYGGVLERARDAVDVSLRAIRERSGQD